MVLSAGIFHGIVLSSRGSGVCEGCAESSSAVGEKAMNDAKWKRGRQTLNGPLRVFHVSYYACIYYKRRLSTNQ